MVQSRAGAAPAIEPGADKKMANAVRQRLARTLATYAAVPSPDGTPDRADYALASMAAFRLASI